MRRSRGAGATRELQQPGRRGARDHHDLLLGAHGEVGGLAGVGAEPLQDRRRQRQQGVLFQSAGRQREDPAADAVALALRVRSEEHTSELQSLMRISYAVFCLKKKNKQKSTHTTSST